MGNKMEHMLDDVYEFECLCGKGTYERIISSYMDNYGKRKTERSFDMHCQDCSSKYVEFGVGQGWILKDKDSITKEKEEAMLKIAKEMVAHIRNKHQTQLLEHVSWLKAKALYELLNSKYTLDTFRKNFNQMGYERVFKDHISGHPIRSLNVLRKTMNQALIFDDYVDEAYQQFTELQAEYEASRIESGGQVYQGRLIRTYQR